MAQQPLVGQGLLIEASRLYPDTPPSVGLLWTNDQPQAVTCTPQHSQETGTYTPGGIRTGIYSKRAATDPRFRPRGHWDRPSNVYIYIRGNCGCSFRYYAI